MKNNIQITTIICITVVVVVTLFLFAPKQEVKVVEKIVEVEQEVKVVNKTERVVNHEFGFLSLYILVGLCVIIYGIYDLFKTIDRPLKIVTLIVSVPFIVALMAMFGTCLWLWAGVL